MGILELKKLGLTVGEKRILHDVSMEFEEGTVHGIVGPNGAGKSTIAFAVMGLEGYTHIQGDIIFKEENINNLSIYERAARGITLSWQEPARYEGLPLKKFMKAAAKDKKIESIKNALFQVGLDPDEYLDRAVDKTLSGGERKKIEVASILVMEPELVLLDEPDSGIDIESIEKIFDIIKVLKEKGTTIILITHSMAVLKQTENAFLLCNGEVVDRGGVGKICNYFEQQCIPCNHKNIPETGEE